jgi:hypothetical protein
MSRRDHARAPFGGRLPALLALRFAPGSAADAAQKWSVMKRSRSSTTLVLSV